MPTTPIQTVNGDNGICPPNFKLNPFTGYYVYCSGGDLPLESLQSVDKIVKLQDKEEETQ